MWRRIASAASSPAFKSDRKRSIGTFSPKIICAHQSGQPQTRINQSGGFEGIHQCAARGMEADRPFDRVLATPVAYTDTESECRQCCRQRRNQDRVSAVAMPGLPSDSQPRPRWLDSPSVAAVHRRRLFVIIAGFNPDETAALPSGRIFSRNVCQNRLLVHWLAVSTSLDAVLLTDRKGLDFFEAKIRPMLVKHCYDAIRRRPSPRRSSKTIQRSIP